MDGHRFDDPTRASVTGIVRRTMVRSLAGGAAGAVVSLIGADGVFARFRADVIYVV